MNLEDKLVTHGKINVLNWHEIKMGCSKCYVINFSIVKVTAIKMTVDKIIAIKLQAEKSQFVKVQDSNFVINCFLTECLVVVLLV
jgi:hypothetical protein